jgi:centrosomal protein CEP104
MQKKFKKIGYLGLDSNERSNFQARELKSVYIDFVVQKVKFSLQKCHTNIHNTFIQVGLIAINVLGEYLNKAGDQINMNNFLEVGTKLEEEMNYDPATLKRLKNLYKAKEKAVELEDFDEAKKIKEAIERLKSVSSQLIQLEERKRIAIKNDDFDAAKLLKYEVERLRNAVAGIQINDNNFIPNTNYNKQQETKKVLVRDDQIYQNDYDDIPMGKEKIKLMPVRGKLNSNNNQDPHEMPLTSDLVMDEDKIQMTKNINPNQGYKLKDKGEIRKKVDVDQQVIKGIDKDFSEMVQEKMNKEKKGGKSLNASNNMPNNDPEQEIEDEIPAAEFKKAEPLIPVLTYDITKMLFSKYWRNKEEGVKILSEEITKHPHSELLSQHGPDKILTTIVGASANILSCNVSQPLMATMDMLKVLFNKFRGSTIQGYLRQDFDNYVDQCMLILIEKVGDSNMKLKEKAENTVMEFANSTLVGHKTVFEDLITGQVKKTLVKSARHLSGRLNLISRMIENFGLNSNDVPLDPLMTYAINGYKDPNKDVRDASFNLIMNVYKYLGEGVRKYFKDLRQAQINTLEEGFENIDGLNQYGGNHENDENQNQFDNSPIMIENKNKKGGESENNLQNKKNKVKKNVEPEPQGIEKTFKKYL